MLILLITDIMTYRYFIKLAYNGAAYKGWQMQPNAISVQQIVENGLASILGQQISLTGCGRTDAGVHASVFYAHFDLDPAFEQKKLNQLSFRLNRFLPHDISVAAIFPVLPGSHARFSALWREYEYLIIREKDPFRFNQAFFVHGDLNIEKMNDCAVLLIGKHNFQSFSKVNTQVNNFICDIYKANWEENGHLIKLTIRTDRFLRKMVSELLGTLLDVGKGKISAGEFQGIIDMHNRCAAGYSVPARGLTLTGVGYPDDLFCENPIHFLPDGSNKIISHYYTDPKFHQSSGNETNE